MKPKIPWADAYHYVNMYQYELIYNPVTHCKGLAYCVVEALNNYTNILKDPKITSIDRLGEALSFLTHLMGDTFQPLHAGNFEDRGGNSFTVTMSSEWKITSKTTNLHSLWDTSIITNWMNMESKTTAAVYQAFVDFTNADTAMKNLYLQKKVDFVEIINDVRYVCVRNVYNVSVNFDYKNLSLKYYNQSFPIVKSLMMRSSLQMAKLFNDIFDNRAREAPRTAFSSNAFQIQYCKYTTIFIGFLNLFIFKLYF